MNTTSAEITRDATESLFFRDIVKGLTATRKTLSPKYFYDEQGSQFFDEICDLTEYYPYRTELNLLPRVAQDLANSLTECVSVVEFGAGSLHKIRPLLNAVAQIEEFIPIDISDDHLRQACDDLQQQYQHIRVRPLAADFCHPIQLPQSDYRRMGFFPGSTIGNFTPADATQFLRSARKTLGAGAKLLIGVDTKKSPDILHQAYNDDAGVTAKFNLNILHRINRELDCRIAVENFEHRAFYDAALGRVEMHLVSIKKQAFRLGEHAITFEQGETIHTENSYKYSPQDFAALAETAGWGVEQFWLAERSMFSMYLLQCA